MDSESNLCVCACAHACKCAWQHTCASFIVLLTSYSAHVNMSASPPPPPTMNHHPFKLYSLPLSHGLTFLSLLSAFLQTYLALHHSKLNSASCACFSILPFRGFLRDEHGISFLQYGELITCRKSMNDSLVLKPILNWVNICLRT